MTTREKQFWTARYIGLGFFIGGVGSEKQTLFVTKCYRPPWLVMGKTYRLYGETSDGATIYFVEGEA